VCVCVCVWSTLMSSTFTGSTRDALAIMVFLQNKYPNECILLKQTLYDLEHKYQNSAVKSKLEMDFPVDWFELGLVWSDGQLYYDKNIRFRVDQCSHRFVLTPFTLVADEFVHANFLIFDREAATLEHFEPFGRTPRIYLHHSSQQLFYKKLSRFGNLILGRDSSFVSLLAEAGVELQHKQEQELRRSLLQRKDTDPGGFCLAWAGMFADVRLSNSLLDIRSIPVLWSEFMQIDDVFLTDYVRDYATRIIKAEQFLREQNIFLSADMLKSLMIKRKAGINGGVIL
jgi:hypothetical protein